MNLVRKVIDDIYYLGASKRTVSLFENCYPVPRGVSYNAYMIKGEKTALLDTIDKDFLNYFLDNVESVLDGRELDYLIINHMEPDHSASIKNIVEKYPNVKIVGNTKTFIYMSQFFDFELEDKKIIVKEGDILDLGNHKLSFVMAPMVHWPEVMMTFDITTKTLFSADAFGTFGAINGNLFADEVEFERDWLDDARRYYTNIVGKYGPQVQAVLKKASTLEIDRICPLHGPIWRENLGWYIEKYDKWSSYTPELNSVLIVYGSIYGNTESVATLLANRLAERNVKNIAMYDVSSTDVSYILADAFKYSHIVFASATYNNGIFYNMECLLRDLAEHNLQNRKIALIQNGTWAPMSGKHMTEIISTMKNIEIIASPLTIKSTLKDKKSVDILAEEIIKTM